MIKRFSSRTSRIASWYMIAVGCVAALSTVSTFREQRWLVASVILLGGMGVAGYGWLVLRHVGVDVDDNGLVLHGSLGRKVIPWTSAVRFELSGQYPWRVTLHTKEGGHIAAVGVGASGFRHGASMIDSQRIVDELNDIIRSNRDGRQ